MAFQSTVYTVTGAGVPGEAYMDTPWRAQPYTIDSASAAYNIIGATFCTKTSQGFCQAGSGGTMGIAGLLISPKEQALMGSIGSPTLTVADQVAVQCATQGTFWVTLPAAAAIGDYVVFDNTTGAISTITPGTSLAGGTSWAYAFVYVLTVSAAGLGIITINPGKDRTTF